ncbi:uncharacterized protein LOC121768662 isoform X2 [Salvia splendens]|nr:uncharacterized protein LOC121768662 isoform X2 [Salvia splendens]
MASKGGKQIKKSGRLQEKRNMSAQRFTSSEGIITKTTMSRNKEAVNMVTYSNRIHRSVPPLPNEDISVDIEEEEEDGSASGHETIGKESRGPTYMSDIRGRPLNLPLISVEYNEFGQPIGGEKSKLCHFLGSIARNGRYCPLYVNNWRAMPKGKKDDMLEFVKARFTIPIIAEKWVVASIGVKWRSWKHYLKTRYWADVPIEHLIHEKDDRVLEDQWINCLTYWRMENAKNISKRNQKARAKKLMNQRTGKTSFAQVKENLTKEHGRCPTRVQLFSSCFVPSSGNASEDVSTKIQWSNVVANFPKVSKIKLLQMTYLPKSWKRTNQVT